MVFLVRLGIRSIKFRADDVASSIDPLAFPASFGEVRELVPRMKD
jgi:hypothetical protein